MLIAYPSWASASEAARLSTLYDVGGIIGSYVILYLYCMTSLYLLISGGIIGGIISVRCYYIYIYIYIYM